MWGNRSPGTGAGKQRVRGSRRVARHGRVTAGQRGAGPVGGVSRGLREPRPGSLRRGRASCWPAHDRAGQGVELGDRGDGVAGVGAGAAARAISHSVSPGCTTTVVVTAAVAGLGRPGQPPQRERHHQQRQHGEQHQRAGPRPGPRRVSRMRRCAAAADGAGHDCLLRRGPPARSRVERVYDRTRVRCCTTGATRKVRRHFEQCLKHLSDARYRDRDPGGPSGGVYVAAHPVREPAAATPPTVPGRVRQSDRTTSDPQDPRHQTVRRTHVRPERRPAHRRAGRRARPSDGDVARAARRPGRRTTGSPPGSDASWR